MLSEIFYWVLNISIIGSFTGLFVLALRRIKKLPRFAVYVLWGIPLLRLWIPFGIANRLSLFNLISKFTTKTVVIHRGLPELSFTNSIMGAKSYFPIEYKTNLLAKIFEIASVIWVIVAMAAILSSVLLYILTKSALKNAEHVKDSIYKSDKISAPAVYGIFRPKIIIPSSISDSDIDYIIMHEMVHIKRKDNLFRVLAVITACIHWFNPLIWIFIKYFFTDMELACDAKVVRKIGKNQVKEYANAVLLCAYQRTYYASAFGTAKTRLRIENILSYKKLSLLSTVYFFALIAAIAVVLLTNSIGA